MKNKIILSISLVFIGLFVYTSLHKEVLDISNKIAVLLPITGDASIYGESAKNAAILADNGEGQILIEDTNLSGVKALSALQKIEILEKSKVKVAISFSSGETLALCPTTEKEHILLLSSGSSPAISSCGKMTFSNFPSDTYQAGVLAEKLKESREVIVLYMENDYGTGVYNEFKNKYVGKIDSFAYLPGQTDYRTMLSSLKSKMANKGNPQGFTLLLISQPKEASIILSQANQLDISPSLIYGTDSLKDESFISKIPKSYIGKLIVVSPNEYLGSEQINFRDAYKSKFNTDPSAYADYVYDNIKLAKKVLHACPQMQDSCVLGYMKTLNSLGSTGNIFFGKSQSAQNKEYNFFTVVQGHFVGSK
ncbi:MAG: ABC transporter substrate-binding protein [Candidatus Pacebacteria bacterium]|nr:ABC transporter substrate-binding protein [Candidatus Paceibacterota bacterium]